MPLWRIAPVTPPDDPRWQGRRIWREMIVRAETAAMARVLAGDHVRRPEDDIGVGNETLDFRSGFDDEKLYWVTEIDGAAAEELGGAAGPPGVLRAEPSDIYGAPRA